MRYYLRLLLLSVAGAVAAHPQGNAVVIDGELSDPFWKRIAPRTLISTEARELPGATGGEVRVATTRDTLPQSFHLVRVGWRTSCRYC